MEVSLEQLLSRAGEMRASDVHLKVGAPPTFRIDGALKKVDGISVLKPADTAAYAQGIFTQKAAEDFKEHNEADFAYGHPEIGRFRVSAFRQRGSVSLVLRRVVPGVPPLDRLGLPPIVAKMANEERGILLVTGPSGSGRSTSLASIIEYINQNRQLSIVTIEDPIEILFPDKKAVVAQREVGVDTASYADGLARALRQDADVIMVSGINDPATAAGVLSAAETGHLVVGAMTTSDPVETINRLLDLFPPQVHRTVRMQLSQHLKGIISQRLLDSADGTGRVLAAEVMAINPRMQEHILSDAPPETFVDTIKDSEFFGMQTFDQSLLKLVGERRLTVAEALPHVRNPHEFRAKVMELGVA